MAPVTSQDTQASPPSLARPRSARGEGDTLRDDLIDAALGLLGASGDPEDVSIRAVAKAAGVSPTAAYRHFANRDDLVEAACTHCFNVFTTLLLEASEGVDDPFERLHLAGEAYLDFAERDEGLYRTLFSNPMEFKDDFTDEASAGRTSFVVLVELVQECIDAGAPANGPGGVGPADATYLAFQVWTWMHGIVDLRITHPHLTWPDPLVMLADLQRTLGLTRPTRPA